MSRKIINSNYGRQEDIYDGFDPDELEVGKIESTLMSDNTPVLKLSDAEAMSIAHRIGKMLREEKMATPHNVDDWLVMIDMIKEVIVNG